MESGLSSTRKAEALRQDSQMERKRQSNRLKSEVESLRKQLATERAARKAARRELKEGLRRFLYIIDNIPLHIVIKDDKNNFVYINETAASERGLARREIEGHSAYEIFPDDAARFYADDLIVIKSGEPKWNIVQQILGASGEKNWISSNKVPWRSAAGKIIGVLISAHNITDMVRQQDQNESLMTAVARALELSEERYYLAVRGSDDGVWDWNLRTDECFFSPRFKELLGYRDDEFANMAESFRSSVHPEDLPGVMEALQAHLEEKSPFEVEFRMRHKNGEWSWFSARGQAVWDKDGKPYRMAGSQRDITDRKQAEQNVNEFFSTVSHELRTPLSAVKGSLRLIEGGLAGQISEEARELLDIGLSSCERLIRLVNDILDLRKIEAGKLELHFNEEVAGELIKEVLQGLSPYAENHGVTLLSDFPPELKLDVDRDRMVQVITNLVGNAIKFSGSGSSVRVQVTRVGPDRVRFSVEDNGPGIPEEKQHLLFMKFKQLDASDSRRQDGTGLGLAICKAIVAQHQGKIGVESRQGQGSTFWFELPENAPPAARDSRCSSRVP
jgi:PAS domain S-box-containing protein